MRCRALSRSVAAVLLVSSSACVAFPPLRVSGQAGGAAGHVPVHGNAPGDAQTKSRAPMMSLRATATPLAVRRTPRRFDFGFGWDVGWTRTSAYSSSMTHGPVVELAWFTHRGADGLEAGWRGGPFVAASAFLDTAGRDEPSRGEGYGASLGALVEIAGPVEYRGVMAIAGGEYAIGVSLRADLRHLDGETHAAAVLSLDVRFPGFAGVMIPLPQHRGPLVR